MMHSKITAAPATLHDRLGDALERMVAIQMTAYPDHWSDADKRECALKHLGMAA